MNSKSVVVYGLLVASMLGFQNCAHQSNLLSTSTDLNSNTSRGPASESFSNRIDFSSDIANATAEQMRLRAENRKLGDEAIRQAQLGISASNGSGSPSNAK